MLLLALIYLKVVGFVLLEQVQVVGQHLFYKDYQGVLYYQGIASERVVELGLLFVQIQAVGVAHHTVLEPSLDKPFDGALVHYIVLAGAIQLGRVVQLLQGVVHNAAKGGGVHKL